MPKFKEFLAEAGKGSTVWVYTCTSEPSVAIDEIFDHVMVFANEKDCALEMLEDVSQFLDEEDYEKLAKDKSLTVAKVENEIDGNDWSNGFQAKKVKIS